MTATAASIDGSTLLRRSWAWVQTNSKRAIRIAAVSFAVGWLINFLVMTTWGAQTTGLFKTEVSAPGNGAPGALFSAVASMVVVAFVTYGMEVGWRTAWADLRALPGTLVDIVRRSGTKGMSLLIWGAATALAVSGVLAPAISGLLAVGLLLAAPTALTGVLGRFVIRFWAGTIGLFAPKERPDISHLGAALIGIAGAAAGLIVASQAESIVVRLVTAGALALVAYLLIFQPGSRPTTAVLAVFFAWVAVWWMYRVGEALAFEECCHAHPVPSGTAAGHSILGGAAAGGGGVAGAAIGATLAGGSTAGSPGGPGPPAPIDVPGDALPTQIMLSGADAEAVLDAWRSAEFGDQVIVQIPPDEQWDNIGKDDGRVIFRDGYRGSIGEVTGITAEATGEGGPVVIVQVNGFDPAGTTPESPIDVGDPPAPDPEEGRGPVTAEIHRTPAPPPPSPPPAPTPSDGGGTVTPPDALPPLPPPPTAPGPTPPDQAAPPAPPPPSESAGDDSPDASDASADTPDTVGDWVEGALADTGALPGDAAAAAGDFVRGATSEVTIPGRFGGKYGGLIGAVQPIEGGVAVGMPSVARFEVQVVDGRLVVNGEPEMIGTAIDLIGGAFQDAADQAGLDLDIPSFDELNGKAQAAADRINQAMDQTGRRITAVSVGPDGNITITAAPVGG